MSHRLIATLCSCILVFGLVMPSNSPAAAAPTFDILEFRVEGNTLLDIVTIERAVYPFLGPGGTVEKVLDATQALESVYSGKGYLTVSVSVPEQKVEGGVVTLRVVEGRVDRLRVTGSRYFSQGWIREKLPALREGEVPNFNAAQQQLSDLSRSRDRRVTPLLKPSPLPGFVDVEVAVADQRPVHGSIEVNNRQAPNTEALRLMAMLRYDNLWQRDHSISGSVLVSPEDRSQVRVLSGTYVMPGFSSGHVMAFYGVRSRSSVAVTGAFNVAGTGGIAGARYIVPLRSPFAEWSPSLILGQDYKAFSEALTLTGADTVTTPISWSPTLLQANVIQRGQKGMTQASLAANFAMRGWFGNNDAEFNRRRAGARANYLALRGEVSREQKLGGAWRLYGRFIGQTASGPLISLEQFFAGGVDTVRGYLEAEALGDDAAMGRVELRSVHEAAGDGPKRVDEWAAYGFVDGGEVRVQQPLPGSPGVTRLLSAGLGMRARAFGGITASADLGLPFETAAFTKAYDPFLHLRAAYDF